MAETKDLLTEWQEARYVAYVNFLRKKGLYDGWRAFRSTRNKQDVCDQMAAYLMANSTAVKAPAGTGRNDAPVE